MDDTDLSGRHEPIWLDTSPGTDYESLEDGVRVDTAVVGGGIVGVATAAKLREAGQSVALLERNRILNGVTGHTTAKLTSLHGLLYDHLVDHFGEREARLYGEANEAAIDDVEATVEAEDIDCDFTRAAHVTYVRSREERDAVRDEFEAARRLGLPASFVEDTELPFDVNAAVRFDDQAHFHPRNYLLALAERIPGDGSYLFENTRVEDVSGGEVCRVATEHGPVLAEDVVLATHFPISDHGFYFARLTPKRSYVVAARLNEDPPEEMYYNTEGTYFSLRPYPGEESMVLIGGQNHRTGHGGSTTARYRALEREARNRFDVDEIEYRWATQDYVSVDRVPLVGELAPHVENVYLATGFGGWGMANGIAAAMVLRDEILGRENPWAEVYRPTRLKVGASAKEFVEHNAHAARHFVEDRVGQQPDLDVSRLDPGEAEVFDDRDDPVAVYRDEDGELHAVSAVCTHMGCNVTWNDGEESWDCPCHGSRFDVDGSVLETPALDDLEALEISPRTTRER